MAKGGFNVRTLLLDTPARLICYFCGLLMRFTIQTSRGERACAECYKEAQQATGPGICPIDGESDTQIFPDKYGDKEIGKIDCYCPNEKFGCKEIINISEIEAHLKACAFIVVSCLLCNADVLVGSTQAHLDEECPKRQVTCRYCKNTVAFDFLQNHYESCAEKLKECYFGCGGLLESFSGHYQTCPKLLSKEACPFGILGCENKDLHENEHDIRVVAAFQQIRNENSFLRNELLDQRTMVNALSEQVKLLSMRTDEKDEKVQKLTERMDLPAAEVQKNDAENRFVLYEAKLESLAQTITNIESRPANSLSPGVDSAAITNCAVKVETLETGFTMINKTVADLDLKQSLLENTSYTGKYVWKVDNLANRMRQAVLGQLTAVHSAPCFTRKYGYKFCLRLYLNGDGIGKATHVSLFFVLMKSECDPLLKWPFSNRVSFKLHNLVNEDAFIRESFLPDATSSSFKKPVRDMNVAAGCPMFVSLDMLRNGPFVKDDAMFIEVNIE